MSSLDDNEASQGYDHGQPPNVLSRSDIADYLDRANYDPEKARALASQERLTNLGVAPQLVAQASAPPAPWSPSAPPARPTTPVAPVAPAPVPSHPLSAPRMLSPAVPKPAAGKIDFSDLGGRPVTAATAAPSSKIDFSDLGGKPVSVPSPEGASPAPEADDDKGLAHQLAGAAKGPFVEVGQAVSGMKDLFAEPQTDDERQIQQSVMLGNHGEAGGRLALALYRAGHGFVQSLADAYAAQKAESSPSGKVLAAGENLPFVGDLVKMMENKEYGQAFTQGLTRAALMKAGGKAGGVPEPIEGAPLTAGEAAGPGLRQSAEKFLSKTGTAQSRMSDVMSGRTSAMQAAAEAASPAATSPEAAGATVQGAARDVLERQRQAQELIKNFSSRAADDAEQARQVAIQKAGSDAQRNAAQDLHANRRSTIEAGNQIAKDISGVDALPVPETDRAIISSLRGANDAAKGEESAAHDALSQTAKEKGISVDPTPMQSIAKDVVELEGPAKDLVMSSLPASVYKTMEKIAGGALDDTDVIAARAKDFGWNPQSLTSDQLAEIKRDIAAHPNVGPQSTGAVPYDVMKTARTAVGEALQSARKHFQVTGMGSNAQRVLQQLYGSMSDAMKASLSDDPELSAQFDKANSLTKQRNATFVDPKSVRKLVYSDDAAKVVGAVMRSGTDADVSALRTALDAEKSGEGLARAQRGAMDYILRKSTKAAKTELPASVSPEAVDYDLALRNAKGSTALRTILGDEKYNKFVQQLDAKRIAQRTPDQIVFDNQLEKILKADSPEKAAKTAGFDASQDADVQAAQRRADTAQLAVQRVQSQGIGERGVQKIAEQAAHELEPSSLIDRASKSPEYTDKLLSVLDKHPSAAHLRDQLGQQIFRNASDNAMVRGAFGSNDGVFDVAKFQEEYGKVRPSLERILPADNLKAMDGFNKALEKYALSKGIGGGPGMSGRFLVIRQMFGALGLARGIATANPSAAMAGAAVIWGPRLWMEMATRPALAARAASVLTKATAVAETVGHAQAKDNDHRVHPSESEGTGFQRPEMEQHKRAGMRVAAQSPDTPEHLKEHLQRMAAPQKGDKVKLPSGQVATVEFSSPQDKLPILRVRTADGKVFRYTRQKDIDVLHFVPQSQ